MRNGTGWIRVNSIAGDSPYESIISKCTASFNAWRSNAWRSNAWSYNTSGKCFRTAYVLRARDVALSVVHCCFFATKLKIWSTKAVSMGLLWMGAAVASVKQRGTTQERLTSHIARSKYLCRWYLPWLAIAEVFGKNNLEQEQPKWLEQKRLRKICVCT